MTDSCKDSEERAPDCYEEKIFEDHSLEIIKNHDATETWLETRETRETNGTRVDSLFECWQTCIMELHGGHLPMKSWRS